MLFTGIRMLPGVEEGGTWNSPCQLLLQLLAVPHPYVTITATYPLATTLLTFAVTAPAQSRHPLSGDVTVVAHDPREIDTDVVFDGGVGAGSGGSLTGPGTGDGEGAGAIAVGAVALLAAPPPHALATNGIVERIAMP